MADWEDEEDAFLYGDTSTAAASTSAAPSGIKAEYSTPQPDLNNVNPLMSLTEQSSVSKQDEGAGEADMEEEDDEEEEEEEQQEEEESDDDFQIIMDANPTSAPPSHHELARKTGAVPVKMPGPGLVREAFRQDPLQPASTPTKRQDSASPTKPSTNFSQLQPTHPTVHPTGTPVPAPSRSPPPNINDTSATFTSTKGDDADSKPVPQPIIDVDLDSIEDKKWRKGGTHLADYFNYGFDEATWKEWTAKQHRMRKDREREKENPFHVFADRPLPEAWASLPMELKGMMMQTIMSSFNGSSGSQQQQQQQMMQGMMMGGGTGSMPMQGNMGMGNMGNMNMNSMGGMPMNMMGGGGANQQQQPHRGMNGMQSNMNMMNVPPHGMDFQGPGNPAMQQQMQQNRGR